MISSLKAAAILALIPSLALAQSSGSSAVPVESAATAASSVSLSIDSSLPQTPQGTAPAGFTVPNLSALTSGAATDATVALDTTPSAGYVPTKVSGAPALPTITNAVASYPALDQLPSVNSTQVQQWLSTIDMSKVPTYGVTDGTCSGTPGAINDGRCWWTCGGCTRATDITVCPDKYTWGLSYDDGPSPNTPLLLDYLNQQNITSTFFVVGSRVLSRPDMLRAEYAAGHQISVHTWSHPYLTKLSNEEIVAELGWTMQVIRDTIGVTPNTFRPPYGDIDDRVRAIAAQMGLTPIIWTSTTASGSNAAVNFDTTDWNIPGGTATGESSLAKFDEILNTYVPTLDTGFIVLEHDLYQQTVDLAVGYVLPMAISSGKYKLESIIACLGRPNSEAYIETSSNSTQTLIMSASSTYFQAAVGSATGSPVLPNTASGSASVSGSASSGASRGASAASGSASSTPSSAAGRGAQLMSLGGVCSAVAALMAVGAGMVFVA